MGAQLTRIMVLDPAFELEADWEAMTTAGKEENDEPRPSTFAALESWWRTRLGMLGQPLPVLPEFIAMRLATEGESKNYRRDMVCCYPPPPPPLPPLPCSLLSACGNSALCAGSPGAHLPGDAVQAATTLVRLAPIRTSYQLIRSTERRAAADPRAPAVVAAAGQDPHVGQDPDQALG